MVFEKPNTEVPKLVTNSKPTHKYNSELFGKIPVCIAEDMCDDKKLFFRVVDREFAEERLRVAQKHWYEYGELPDKGQFPFVEYDGQSRTLIFDQNIYVVEGEESDKITKHK